MGWGDYTITIDRVGAVGSHVCVGGWMGLAIMYPHGSEME